MVRAFSSISGLLALGLALATGCKEPAPLEGVTKVATGNGFACAIADGELWCWGWSQYTGLGDPETLDFGIGYATKIEGLGERFVDLSTYYQHVCAVTAEGRVWCWGDNGAGQLGGATDGYKLYAPAEVPGLADVVGISAGLDHTCALTAEGTVKCWGGNCSRQVGAEVAPDLSCPPNEPAPVDVVGLSGEVVSIGAGFEQTCAILADGKIACWGDTFDGDQEPIVVEGIEDPTEVSCMYQAVYVRTAAGTVSGWGKEENLGTGVSFAGSTLLSPIEISAWQSGVTSVHRGCVVADGRVSCSDYEGGIVEVPGMKDAIEVRTGTNLVCAISSDNRLWCWGDRLNGQIGNGPYELGDVPTVQAKPALVLARQ